MEPRGPGGDSTELSLGPRGDTAEPSPGLAPAAPRAPLVPGGQALLLAHPSDARGSLEQPGRALDASGMTRGRRAGPASSVLASAIASLLLSAQQAKSHFPRLFCCLSRAGKSPGCTGRCGKHPSCSIFPSLRALEPFCFPRPPVGFGAGKGVVHPPAMPPRAPTNPVGSLGKRWRSRNFPEEADGARI